MKAAFRTDASLAIGIGNVMRCLALADALRLHGAQRVFLCRDHVGHLHQVIQDRGYSIMSLGGVSTFHPTTAEATYEKWLGVDSQRDADDTQTLISGLALDWLVVDHYGLDAIWEHSLRPTCGQLMVVDDLTNRDHAGDVLLDQNLGKTPADYSLEFPRLVSCCLAQNTHCLGLSSLT